MDWNTIFISDLKKALVDEGNKMLNETREEISFINSMYKTHFFLNHLSNECDLYVELYCTQTNTTVYIEDLILFYNFSKLKNELTVEDLIFLLRLFPNDLDKIQKDILERSISYTNEVIDAPIHQEIETAWKLKKYKLVNELIYKLSGSLTENEKRWIGYIKKFI